jgi:hypothetical protein
MTTVKMVGHVGVFYVGPANVNATTFAGRQGFDVASVFEDTAALFCKHRRETFGIAVNVAGKTAFGR